MAAPTRDGEQVLQLLAAANIHGDLAVKLSSLKQAKDIIMSVEPAHAVDLFPLFAELQASPEALVRKYLVDIIDEIGAKTREDISIFFPVLIKLLKDNSPGIAKQSIITGSIFFSHILVDIAIQFQQHGIVERWLEERLTWMDKFKNAVLDIIFEAGPVSPKLIAVKFLETYVLHFTSDSNNFSLHTPDEIRQEGVFNISWLRDGHPILDQTSLLSDANRYLGILMDMLSSANDFPGPFLIASVNSLAAIARKRPVYYSSILPALLNFRSSIEKRTGCHTISIHYSLRTAFLGFLRCMHPVMVESRDELLKELRATNAGDAADQVIRQVEKIMKNNGRASWDLLRNKEDQLLNQIHVSEGGMKKRLLPLDNENQSVSIESASKKPRYSPQDLANATIDGEQNYSIGINPELPIEDGDMSPVEQMIAMIGALIAEGERGVESLEILITNMHPDLLADIVITNMKKLPKNPSNLFQNRHCDSVSHPGQFPSSNGSQSSPQTSEVSAQRQLSSSNTSGFISSDVPTANVSTDLKRDPRRDPRRLDPRRIAASDDVLPSYAVDNSAVKSDFDSSRLASPWMPPPPSSSELLKPQSILSESYFVVEEQSISKDEMPDLGANDTTKETSSVLHDSSSFIGKYEDTTKPVSVDVSMLGETYSPSSQEFEQVLPDTQNTETSEIASAGLSGLPLYIGLSEVDQAKASQLAIERIIKSYHNTRRTDYKQTQTALLARLFAMIDVNDMIGMIHKCVTPDYEQQKGHELVIHILYYLHSLMTSDTASTSAAVVYDRFLLEVATFLLDVLPASDKSFSRLLGEVPSIPGSLLSLLDDLCTKSNLKMDGHDGDRVTQGLGAVWSLILGRPTDRQACLDIALKCAVHPKDDVRTKAIRLVSNKLYAISHLSLKIEQYAIDLFVSTVAAESGQRIEGQVECTDTSASGSQISERLADQDRDNLGTSTDDSSSASEAHTVLSLFFALSAKKPVLLQYVFDNFGQLPWPSKQAVQRHLSVLVRSMGSSCTELLNIISDPPMGSDDLVIQVLHFLCESTVPSSDLVMTIKRLYETRLKDATVLIPILAAFSRDEVFPIFPQLIQLPLDKFQTALAHILQGSAQTGPALTPVDVLVAIHDISPEKEGIPLKKITDACSACFEQRTVFTQQVLTKALNQMVDQNPLPLLFMRTVIQAIDAFPTMVSFIMELLAKLVNRQIWRMPKLWIGFLKCVSQTQPHSFNVLLQLPSPQLESALTKYPNLRAPLAAYVNKSCSKADLQRSTLLLLGMTSPS